MKSENSLSITYTIDRNRQLILTRISGDLTITETIEYFNRLKQDYDCPNKAIEMVDFTEVTDFSIHYGDMRIIIQKFQGTKTTKKILATIFNCPTPLSYGIGRMLQALHETVNEQHHVAITKCEQEMIEYVKHLRTNTPIPDDAK